MTDVADLSLDATATDMTADGTAVELFGEWHDREGDPGATTYRSLLPATAPGPGQQYRFEVDLDQCTGCKACVSACHSLNGLDEDETWRSVGLLVGGGAASTVAAAPPAPAASILVPVWQQHVTTACHHCLEPACLAGCPVEAYEKDPVSGIVAHLDDQCIGCRYCMLTCPYEIPTFNDRLGVVRKCDMCSDRLAEGEAPACVQGCPTDAISIGLVNTVELAADLALDPAARLVPTAPRSAHTGPTTVYITERPVPAGATAADDHRIVPAHNHPPLVAMLVLTQLSVGAFLISQVVERWVGRSDGPFDAGAVPAFVAWATALVAIGASVLHLGRPLMAWRAVLGLRHSWLSREIVAFGVYAPLGGLTAATAVGWLPGAWEDATGAATALVGLVGVWCSAKLYAVTARPFWRLDRTLLRFGFVMAGSGGAAVATTVSVAAAIGQESASAADRVGAAMALVVLGSVAVAVLAAAVFLIRHRGRSDALGRSAWLLLGPLRTELVTAVVLAVTAAVIGIVTSASSVGPGAASVWWALALVLVTVSGWIERGLFFVAAAPDRMPGGFH